MIYYGLLPPLIFEAGFTMRKRKFFANFGTIFLYAVIGTLIAIVATGTLLWALNLDGSIDPNLNVNHFMLFGALISSTDPIATLGILKSAGANPLLYDLIFGESALNDCIAIVVFHIFHDLAIASDGRRLGGDGGSGEPPQPSSPTYHGIGRPSTTSFRAWIPIGSWFTAMRPLLFTSATISALRVGSSADSSSGAFMMAHSPK